MQSSGTLDVEVDAIEEIRLRTWARENFVPAEERDSGWHPIVLDEMTCKDREVEELIAAQ